MSSLFSRHIVTHAAVVFALSAHCLIGTSFAANEIELFDETNNSVGLYDAADLDDALGDLDDDYRLELTPGVEYPLVPTTVTNPDRITINGGYTIRIAGVYPTSDEFASASHGLSEDDEIVFFGDTPAGINKGQTYYVRSPVKNLFSVSATETGNAVNITADNDDHLLFGIYHAKIVPTSSTTTYDFLLKLNSCSAFTIKNVTFDGKYQQGQTGYENGFKTASSGKKGQLLLVEDCAGINTLRGVQVANNRGKKSGVVDSSLAIAVNMVNCGEVSLTDCMGQRTGYATWRSQGTDKVTYNYCRSENPHHRCITDTTAKSISSETVDTITIKNSDFIRDEAREAGAGIDSDEAYSLVGNINPYEQLNTFLMENCYCDWAKCEGTDFSWDFTANTDSCLLLKIQGIKTATFKSCTFKHGGNKWSGYTLHCFSLKTDKDEPVKTLYLDECYLSGAVLFADDGITPNDLNQLFVRGSHLMADGHFGSRAALVNPQYGQLVISSYPGGTANTKVDNINDFSGIGSVIRLRVDFDELSVWQCNDLIATGVSGTGDYFFCRGNPTSINSPFLNDMNSNFQSDNVFQNADKFEFSEDDPIDIKD